MAQIAFLAVLLQLLTKRKAPAADELYRQPRSSHIYQRGWVTRGDRWVKYARLDSWNELVSNKEPSPV